MSSGCPTRPSRTCPSTVFWKSPPTKLPAREPSVSITPGLIEFTRILRGPSSLGSREGCAARGELRPASRAVGGASRVVVWSRHDPDLGGSAVPGGGERGTPAAGGRLHLRVCRAHGRARRIQGDLSVR